MKNFASPDQINHFESKVTHYDSTILLAWVAFSIVLLIAIYLASMSPGTALGELALMTVLP